MRAPSRLPPWEWRIVAIATMAAAVAVAVTAVFIGRAQASYEIQVYDAELEAEMNELATLVTRGRLSGPSATLAAHAAEAIDDFRERLDKIRRTYHGDLDEDVVAQGDRLLVESQRAQRALALGDPVWFDTRFAIFVGQVDSLHETIERATAENALRARHDGLVAKLVGLAGMLTTLAAVLAAAFWMGRTRAGRARAAETAAADLATRNARLVEATSQLERAEAQFRALVEHLPGITYINSVSMPPANLYVSPQTEHVLGYPAEHWQGEGFFECVVHRGDLTAALALQREVREHGGALRHEYRLVTAAGRTLWFEDSVFLVRDSSGAPLHVQGYLADVSAAKAAQTARERLLEQEREANERLREADRMKDEFVALVSHELRTPLTSIRGYLDLVLELGPDELSDEAREFLTVVERNAARLQRLVGDLLFVAQVDAERLVLDLDHVDLADIVRDAIEASAPAAAAKGVALDLQAPQELILPGDAVRLAQLVDNLVSNAVKFTPTGGTVQTTIQGSHDHASLAVTDTGMGIPADEQANLFEPFFRTSRATRDAIQGTGLGLTISKAIVEAHGGSITVESADPQGTTVRVLIPLAA